LPAGSRRDHHAVVVTVNTAHTADLPEPTLRQARELLDRVFDQMTDADWDHALGGIHALCWDGDELIGHACVVQRRLLHQDRALRTGYVEGVAVHPDRQRQGHGRALMRALDPYLRGGYELGALCASHAGQVFYPALGWQVWRGPLAMLTPSGVVPTPEELGGVMVLPGPVPLALDAPLTCDWREGDAW
jgi:aminoglycoside 2'-N-acetyltransferase I